jgi:hypothetical protein
VNELITLTRDFFMLRSRSVSNGIATSTISLPYSMSISSITESDAPFFILIPLRFCIRGADVPFTPGIMNLLLRIYRPQLFVVRNRNAFLRLEPLQEYRRETSEICIVLERLGEYDERRSAEKAEPLQAPCPIERHRLTLISTIDRRSLCQLIWFCSAAS